MSATPSPTEARRRVAFDGRSPAGGPAVRRVREPRRRRGGRSGWWRWTRRIHLVVGLTVGVIFALSGLTGSALVFRDELDAALHPEMLRVVPVPTSDRIPLDAAIAAAESAGGAPAAWIRMPEGPRSPYEVALRGEDPLEVYVHPGTGAVLGTRRASETLPNVLFSVHHTLLGGETGERVLGVTALLVFILLATGLVVWWPGMKRGWTGLRRAVLVRRSRNWRTLTFDVHRAGGFWAAALLAVSAFTGASLVFHDAFMAGLNGITGSPPRPAAVSLPARTGDGELPVEALARRFDGVVPGEITYVTLPGSATAPLVVRKRAPGEWHPSGRNFIQIDPARGALLAVEAHATAPLGTRLYNVLYPVHTGAWGGLPARLLSAVLGLAPALLLVSGGLLWWWRRR